MTASASKRQPHRYVMFHVYFLLVFLVLFPKGGIKATGIPLTWGYLYLAVSTPLVVVLRLLAAPLRVRGIALLAVFLMLPIQIAIFYALFSYGFENTGYTVSMITGLAIFPWLFLLVYPAFLQLTNPQRFSACLRLCMLTAALWGIFLFFLHPFYGRYIEIPYLTVNADDYGLLESTKYNARGFYLKLIATYNNGNLYGVATLILLPLYNVLEPSRWKRGVMLTALLLTLSRTVWVGLMVLEAIPLVEVVLRQARSFPVVYLGTAAKRVIALVAMGGLVLFVLFFTTNSGLSFLLDSSLGGRAGEFPALNQIGLLPVTPLVGFDESLYGSAARFYGWIGLVGFILFMVSPVLVLLADTSAFQSKTRMAAFKGLMLYSVVAFSDGAFVLIPVTAFYWFIYMVFLYGWPGSETHALRAKTAGQVAMANPKLVLEPT